VVAIGRDLATVATVWREVPELPLTLAHPQVPQHTKETLLRQTLADVVHPFVANTLRLLVRRGRARSLPDLHDAYLSVAEDAGRLVRVGLRLARPIDEEVLEHYRTLIQSALGREVVLEVGLDADLLAGAELFVGGRRLDASLRGRLQRLNEQLKG